MIQAASTKETIHTHPANKPVALGACASESPRPKVVPTATCKTRTETRNGWHVYHPEMSRLLSEWHFDPRRKFMQYTEDLAWTVKNWVDNAIADVYTPERKLADDVGARIEHEYYCNDAMLNFDTKLSNEEKNQLIQGLKGYCQQISWDSLVEQLHPKARPRLLSMIIRVMISKALFDDVILDPFFWLDETSERPMDFEDLFVPSKSQMHNLWQWQKRVDPTNAPYWMMTTQKMLLSRCIASGKEPELGERMWDRRDIAIERIAQNLYDSSLFRKLLPEHPDPEEKYSYKETFLALFQDAGMRNMELWCCATQPISHNIEDLPPYWGIRDAMELDSLTNFVWGDSKETMRRGRYPLLVYRPSITQL
ncbi:hypothetical protein FE257_012221 [Aspergillus nanangensis]|uniref:Uncharacterized protein n=1 Tax=Aspergillus nanangensis TaxID=2582783 RepID=A0AAD4CG75_ASPNN|nr:hypothetical protein FE257_012221 [Aspergillus nanangensis]